MPLAPSLFSSTVLFAALAQGPSPPCIVVTSEARFVGLAYNHLVYVADNCEYAVSCAVSTDVNPDPQAVSVAPGRVAEVVTFQGSPASVFTPVVRCAPVSRKP